MISYPKCDTKYTLCNDNDDTCATVLKNLEVSETHVYMVRVTHLQKDHPLKQVNTTRMRHATLACAKRENFGFLQKEQVYLEKTHTKTLHVCDNNMQR